MASAVDPEMKSRFDAAEKTRIHLSALARPALAPSSAAIRRYFATDIARAERPLRNPHVEPEVTAEERAKAVPASVLIAIVDRAPAPTVIVTRRPEGISFPGHWVFPGGRGDPGETPLETALRESEEEIGLARDRLEVLGRLGEYVSHSGFRIAPVVALVDPNATYEANPTEVDEIAEVELARLCDPRSYFMFSFADRRERAHFAMETGDDQRLLTGVTCSLAIGLYGALLEARETGALDLAAEGVG